MSIGRIGLFSKKQIPSNNIQNFTGIKIKKKDIILNRNFSLNPKFKYRAGSHFDEFMETYRRKNPLKVKFYLTNDEVMQNNGLCRVEVIDANNYEHHKYKKLDLNVNKELNEKIKSNILYAKTVDSGSDSGRVGLGIIQDEFKVSGGVVLWWSWSLLILRSAGGRVSSRRRPALLCSILSRTLTAVGN